MLKRAVKRVECVERRNDLNQSLNGESIVEGNTRKGEGLSWWTVIG